MATPQQQQLSQENLNRIVLEYLSKRGYARTEAMFRMESKKLDSTESKLVLPEDYTIAYESLKNWIYNSLEIHKNELLRTLYPSFVHIFLNLIDKGNLDLAKEFFEKHNQDHVELHNQDLRNLALTSARDHLTTNQVAVLFRNNRYKLAFHRVTFNLLLGFLFDNEDSKSSIVMKIFNENMDFQLIEKRPNFYDQNDVLNYEEGFSSYYNDKKVDLNQTAVNLGPMPQPKEFEAEVEAELAHREKEDFTSSSNLLQQFKEKRAQEACEANLMDTIPLPAFLDVENEVASILNIKNRISLSPQTSLPSICMYTLHNTYDCLNCVAVSKKSNILAAGFSESFVQLWSLGDDNDLTNPQNNLKQRKLRGHSGAIYSVSFSPDNQLLLSCSKDKSTRLWSLETNSALVSYKGHSQTIWDVQFGPFGQYFATASHDQTARLWSVEHIQPLRIFAGHLADVDCVVFHPNSAYVATGSSDKTCRLWDVSHGNAVRLFIGDSYAISCVKVSPNGKMLASATVNGTISLWDIGSGRRIKFLKGHSENNSQVYSLAFSQEGTTLLSSASDSTVKVWDLAHGENSSFMENEKPLDSTFTTKKQQDSKPLNDKM